MPWDAEQKARHSLRLQKQSRHHKAIAVLDFAKSSSKDKEAREYASSGFPITTLDRLLSDREFREFLGLDLAETGEITFRIAPEEAAKPISRVIKDFGSGAKNVRDVINKEKRAEYIHSLPRAERPDLTKLLQEQITLNDATSAQKLGDQKSQTKFKDPKLRKTIVIPGTAISINAAKHNRARRVFDELRRIQIKDKQPNAAFPNAAVLLLRLFVEMSVDLYIKSKGLTHPKPTGWKEVSLTERTRSVLGDLQSANRLDKADVKVMSKVLANPTKLANPNSLNDYAPNPSQVVHPGDIIDIWDTYTKFLTALWETLQ